ncbi:MAG: PEGA domain-containing protein [Methanomicrobiales archaeon]|nr:PEGA domain-containing protein [Methanomicrobiales archaeon]
MKTKNLIMIMLVLLVALATLSFVGAESVMNPIGGEEGYYDISSSPSGAMASVDGTNVGSTPTTATVYVTGTPGHTITVSKEGYQPWAKYYSTNPPAGGHVSVFAQLVPIPVTLPATPPPGGEKGYYSIQSSPTGSVTFDNKYVGTTPVTVDVSTSGTPGHTIVVTATGYQSWTQSVTGNPAAGQTVNIYAQLTPVQPQGGNIYVSSSPQGATAVLDNGQDSLVTPGTFYNVAPGWHNVRVTMPGYQAYSDSNVQVTNGGTTNVFANLVRTVQSGSLSISSIPKGAGLYVDNIYQGETNQIVGGLAVGSHTVTLKLAGYQTFTTTYGVNSGQTTYASVTLVPVQNPSTGDLLVTSSPSGAAVYLNGNYQGVTTTSGGPLDITDLTAATYTVVLKKSGYNDYTTTVKIVGGQTAQVAATLQSSGTPPSGTVSAEIFSTPEGADVYVNNVYKGVTPLNFQNVPLDTTQTYTVTIKMDGYTPYTTSGKVTPGQSVQINAALSPVATPVPTQPLGMISVLSALGICSVAVFLFRRKTL